MGGLLKFAMFSSPVLIVILVFAFHSQEEHKAKTEVLNSQFDQTWNEMSAGMTRDSSQKAALYQRATAAQSQMSSAKLELAGKTAKVQDLGKTMDNTVNSLDSELKERSK